MYIIGITKQYWQQGSWGGWVHFHSDMAQE
jgi:hypothetical protein